MMLSDGGTKTSVPFRTLRPSGGGRVMSVNDGTERVVGEARRNEAAGATKAHM